MSNSPSSALAEEGASIRHAQPFRRQVLASAIWLGCSLSTAFLICLAFDIGVILFGPLALLASLIWFLCLVARGVKLALPQRGDRAVIAWATALAAPVSAIIFIVLLRPTMQVGTYLQAQTTLMIYLGEYQKVISDPDPSLDKVNGAWAKIGDSGTDRLFAFSYGGFLNIDRDIVYDTKQDPERRSIALLGAVSADCRHLRSHFFDCTLDY